MDLEGRRTVRWYSRGKQVLLAAVGVAIAFNGVVVAAAPHRIPAVYDVAVGDADTGVLLRHRAVMLALIGALLVASARWPALQPAAVTAAATSMATFALFAYTAEVNDAQRRVALADVVLLGLLAVATVIPDAGRRRSWRRSRS